MKNNKYLLQVENAYKYFYKREGLFKLKKKAVRSVNGINLEIRAGQILAIVGESGSGKTTLGKTIIRIYRPTEGRIWYKGNDISTIDGNKLRYYRKHMQMVFQDPTASLNPRKTVFDSITLPLKVHFRMSMTERRKKAKKLINRVELPGEILHRYPHALSGGQKQRVNIARALASTPELIVLDEPTSALDVSVQAKILTLLKEIKKELDLTYIYISHDLAVVKNISDRIAVMYLGQIVEISDISELFEKPYHPYSKALLSAIPVISDDEKALIPEEITLSGEVPTPTMIPLGCSFYSRCQERMDICKTESPTLKEIEEGHYLRCFHRHVAS